jgi:hypothetical protein
MLDLIPMHCKDYEVHVVVETHGNSWWLTQGVCEALGPPGWEC